ncbi:MULTISPECIES: MaoC family dehydratase [Nocardiaceae]|uniref:MaoC family dehydratase n=1 Tax=Nocardiaceae TaxID=85025 RepID=UPI0003638448|nr:MULTISPECIES: MaoC family dehydratase [Rhodococcus]OZC49184.1 dehydratase [Rhodococcus sp. 06-621-2]OZC53278.1 dehydratase [Rhodococcus sp. RS1C4]OZC87539.1 dehydratase [Rhodococcus sp. 06-418-1B]OZD12369.1 dehydratase [Rhodococcus sp. 06-156-3C]OZD13828.1 dehydratase [Rhodococcus sp. 06-156-4C]
MATHPATLGRFFEDYVVGDVYQHPLGRTISEADNTWITLLSMNTNQNHFNAHVAEQNPITEGRVIVNSGLTVAVVLGISVLDMSQNAISNLAFTDIKMSHPLYAGDTLYAESLCTDKRESKSRPYAGIISMITRGLNQDGDEIISWKRSVMIATRASGIGQNYFPDAKAGPLELSALVSTGTNGVAK